MGNGYEAPQRHGAETVIRGAKTWLAGAGLSTAQHAMSKANRRVRNIDVQPCSQAQTAYLNTAPSDMPALDMDALNDLVHELRP